MLRQQRDNGARGEGLKLNVFNTSNKLISGIATATAAAWWLKGMTAMEWKKGKESTVSLLGNTEATSPRRRPRHLFRPHL